ncbi:MAG: hypothetical protein WBA51_06105 [Erythrobacter sp.]
MKNVIGALAALGLVMSPVAAVAVERAAAPVEGQSELGGSADVLVALGLFVAVIGTFVILGDDDNDPISA